MGQRIGIIAGSGEYPFVVLEEARKKGFSCIVLGIKEQAEKSLRTLADVFGWVGPGDIGDAVSFFLGNGVDKAVFAGKIDHRIVFKKKGREDSAGEMIDRLKNKSPTFILSKIIGLFGEAGIHILDPTPFLASCMDHEGLLTKTPLTDEVETDLEYAWGIAVKLADLDIGQTVAVKDRTIVALEGLEGTDAAIERAGRLAGKGTVIVKVCRSNQDPRVDLPAVGLETVKSCIEAGCRALCIEARRMPFFQMERALILADSHRFSIFSKSRG